LGLFLFFGYKEGEYGQENENRASPKGSGPTKNRQFINVNGGVEQSGLIGRLLNAYSVQNVQSLPLFMALTILFSNVISNVPAVMILKFLIPVSSSHIWWASMAVFSTLAGNLTLTGSIANLIVVEQAKKQNVDISFSTYLKIGLPLTIAMVVLGLVYFRLLFGI
jgi:Na+/H+ antiporter NhaD/arsenite permease-like protein